MDFLQRTFYLDYDNESVQNLVAEFAVDTLTKKQKAIAIYFKIRDQWRYNPYRISFEKEAFRASRIARKQEGHCIEKSILLTASLRALQIPAKLRLSKVRNHIGAERLTEKFGTNELTPHGMVTVLLDGKWLKASPAFNKELCMRCNVAALDFDGETDSVFQEFDRSGNTFMEYLEDYGTFDDVPVDFILKTFKDHYPELYSKYAGEKEIWL